MTASDDYALLKVLEIMPYEPPASGWVKRVKLLRQVIADRGGECQILDIGPSRKVAGRDCICVYSARDYLTKVVTFARQRYSLHAHINAEYFRGQLLMLAALIIGRLFGCRTVTTFHAGLDQPYFYGWKKIATWPLMAAVFLLSHAVVCNSKEVKQLLTRYTRASKIHAIQAFSVQYIDYEPVEHEPDLKRFIESQETMLMSYLCIRDGFFVDVLIDALARFLPHSSKTGLVIVGTGGDIRDYCDADSLEHVGADLFMAGDLGHDAFMSLLAKSDLCIRTPVTDGISATVLESLALGTPVLASDNGTRPEGVTTYQAANAIDLANKLSSMLDHDRGNAAPSERLSIPDTTRDEIDLLLPGNGSGR